ncbi:MAG TPA: hypothetical protein PLA74_03575, partial [Syntrophales bacterium]|nr:hypothetical protein [Syntrophales bacterium]
MKRISIFELLPHQLRLQREIVLPRRGAGDIPGEVLPCESQLEYAGFSRVARSEFREDVLSPGNGKDERGCVFLGHSINARAVPGDRGVIPVE